MVATTKKSSTGISRGKAKKKTVLMHCPHCSTAIGGSPEAFVSERRCPACSEIGVFTHESHAKATDVPATPVTEASAAAPDTAALNAPAAHPSRSAWRTPVEIALVVLLLGLTAMAAHEMGKRQVAATNEAARVAAAKEKAAQDAQRQEESARFSKDLAKALYNPDFAERATILSTLRSQVRERDLPVQQAIDEAYLEAQLAIREAEYKERLNENQEQWAAMRQEMQAMQMQLTRFDAKAKNLEDAEDRLQNTINARDAVIATLQKKLKTKESAVDKAQLAEKKMRDQSELVLNKLADYERTLSLQQAELASLQSTLARNEQELAEAKKSTQTPPVVIVNPPKQTTRYTVTNYIKSPYVYPYYYTSRRDNNRIRWIYNRGTGRSTGYITGSSVYRCGLVNGSSLRVYGQNMSPSGTAFRTYNTQRGASFRVNLNID